MSQLTFQAVTLIPVSHNNQTYITSSDLARALQYARTDSISRIYERNSDEFTADMTTTVKLTVVRETGNVEMDQRIFSLRGAHLIAMFARTPVAKEFRKWVLDILDKEVLQNSQQNLPLAQPDLAQIVQAVQQAMPQPKEIYQARNLHEVLPLAFLYNKIAVLAEDFLHLYKFLHQKGHGTMAEICKNHFNALNADTALMNRASCCIQRLTLDLSDEDQDTVRRLCLG